MRTAMNIDQWITDVRADLAVLRGVDVGFRIHGNEIWEPSCSDLVRIAPPLHRLYRALDGLSFADVRNGYFIHRAAHTASCAANGDPVRVEGELDMDVQVFGSDGGGSLFVVDVHEGAIYYLPSSGPVYDGVYYEQDFAPVRRSSDCVDGFLLRLQADVRAFLEGNYDHVYLTD